MARGTLVIAAALAVALVVAVPSRGASASAEAKRRAPAVDRNTGKHLNKAVEQLRAQHYTEARAALGKLNLERLSPYERSRAEQLFAALDQVEGHYGAAREHLEQALASGGLNDEEASTTRFQIAQLYMAEEKWREGIAALKQWFAATPNPNSAAYHLLAVAYYQIGDYDSALEPAQKAIELAGGHPQESWLQLLLALRLQRKEYTLAVPILKQLVQAAPEKKNYWLQLSAVNSQLGDYTAAAVPMQLAYRAGLLTEGQDIEQLAQLLVQVTIPYRAGQILSQAIERGKLKEDRKLYELLANCWIAAREYDKATEPLERAAELSENGELYVRLGEVYVQREKWGQAIEALHKGLQKGKLKSPGNADILIGLSLYNQKKLAEARPWFERARGHADSREQADAWLEHIEEESQSVDKTAQGAS